VTAPLRRPVMQQLFGSNDGELRRDLGGSLLVTRPLRCPTIRAASRPIPPASTPKPARDIRKILRLFAEPVTDADARARRHAHPARASRGAVVRAFACELDDNDRCTSADDVQLVAQLETTSDTRCNIDVAPSHRAYRMLTLDPGGSFLASRPGSILASSEGQGDYARGQATPRRGQARW
jgi:hypothetical protein